MAEYPLFVELVTGSAALLSILVFVATVLHARRKDALTSVGELGAATLRDDTLTLGLPTPKKPEHEQVVRLMKVPDVNVLFDVSDALRESGRVAEADLVKAKATEIIEELGQERS